MNDDVDVVTTTAPEPAPARRPRVRWWQVAVLVVAVALASAAFGFMTTRQSERDDAAAELRSERRAVAMAKTDANAAAQNRDAARVRNQPTIDRMNEVMATAHSLAGIAPQGVDASKNIEQLALANSVGELNSTALPHSDDLAHQWTDLVDTFGTQMAKLPNG